MVTVQDIKKDLPNWPDEVVSGWLLGLANRLDTGWPPPADINDHARGPILGWRPLAWWKNVTWTLEEQDLSYDALCKGTQKIAVDMVKEIEEGDASDNSEERFKRALGHLVEAGEFQVAPVVMKLDDGISVIDGNHRVTALLSTQANSEGLAEQGLKTPRTQQKVWMGQHSDGEVPLDYPEGL